MYHQFNVDDFEGLRKTVKQLKEECTSVGDYKTYYKAWGNEIIKIKSHIGRPQAMKEINALRDFAIQHDHKFGLYTATYTTAYILGQINDRHGAYVNYLKAADYLKRYFPEESTAPIYVSLSTLTLSEKKDTTAIRYAEAALKDPQITPTHRYMARCCICTAWGWIGNVGKFDEAYAKLKAIKAPPKEHARTLIVEIFRAHLHGQHDEAIKLAHQFKSRQNYLLYVYKTYEWAGDYKKTFYAFKDYRWYLDSVNHRDLRQQAQLYHSELDVARAENESKELRLANKRLKLEHMAHELENERLEVEAAKLKLQNTNIELSNAAIKLKNDSLQQQTQHAKLNEIKSRMEAQQQSEHAHHILIVAASIIALITIAYLLFFLYRRHRQMKRLESMNAQLQTAYDQLEKTTTAKERIESELRIARDIQMSMLPQVFPHRSDFQLYARMTPAKAVGGDLYDFFLQDNLLYLCIGDVSGKGVPASMFMSVAVKLFRTFALEGYSPVEVATRMNESLAADNENGMFVTMFIATVDLKTGRMNYCNAGHNPPLLDGEFMTVEPNAPLGLWQELEFVEEHQNSIKGRSLFLYTDGITEAENEHKDQYGEDRMQELLKKNLHRSAHQTIDCIHESVSQFVGKAEPSDDITKLCLKLI